MVGGASPPNAKKMQNLLKSTDFSFYNLLQMP